MSKKLILAFWLVFCLPFAAFAQYFTTPPLLVPYTSNAPEIVSTCAVLIDAQTGALLYSKNPDEEISPASLTKLMTMHLLMKEIEAGKASYDELIPITKESWAQSQPPRSSLMFLAPGQIVTLREIMLGLAIPSGNDAAVAAALRLAPTMEDFAALMTEEARRMGLTVTRFTEASGISEFNMTTAAEFAHFCRQYILLHPQSLKDFHSVPVFPYPVAENVPQAYRNNVKTIVQYNHNNLLRTFPGVDGLKTGYIDWAFDNFKTLFPLSPVLDTPRVWKGKTDYVSLSFRDSLEFTSRVDRADPLYFRVEVPDPLIAPLPAGSHVGDLIYYDNTGDLRRIPLLTNEEIEAGGFFKRLFDTIQLFFRGLFADRS